MKVEIIQQRLPLNATIGDHCSACCPVKRSLCPRNTRHNFGYRFHITKRFCTELGPRMCQCPSPEISRQTYHGSKTINLHNQQISAVKNTQGIVPRLHQQGFSIKIWAGFFGDCLLGPYLLPHRLKGPSYTAFLANRLSLSQAVVPLTIQQTVYFKLNGARPPWFQARCSPVPESCFSRTWDSLRSNECMVLSLAFICGDT